jgi:hypothetical protein
MVLFRIGYIYIRYMYVYMWTYVRACIYVVYTYVAQQAGFPSSQREERTVPVTSRPARFFTAMLSISVFPSALSAVSPNAPTTRTKDSRCSRSPSHHLPDLILSRPT